MGNYILKGLNLFQKDEAINVSDMKLSLPRGMKIRDQREIFLLKFPFYQMEVVHFQQLVKSIQTRAWTDEAELF